MKTIYVKAIQFEKLLCRNLYLFGLAVPSILKKKIFVLKYLFVKLNMYLNCL